MRKVTLGKKMSNGNQEGGYSKGYKPRDVKEEGGKKEG